MVSKEDVMEKLLHIIAALAIAACITLCVIACHTTGTIDAKWNIAAERPATADGESDVNTDALSY